MPRTPPLAALSRTTWLVALLTFACPLLTRAATEHSAAAAREQAEEALRLASSPRSAAQLIRLHALQEDLEDLTPLVKTYTEVATRRDTDPGTRATAWFLFMDLERARGRLTRASEIHDALGFIGDFYVVGGFDNEGKAGCDTDFGPEAAALDLSTTYPGAKGRQVSWRRLAVSPSDGYVDLGAAVRPNREAVAYALTWLEAPAETRVALGVGTSGAFRLWVNGEKVATSDHYNVPRPDQSRVSVRLRKGLNRVLLKVCQESGPLGFYLRRDPPARLRPTLPSPLPALTKGPSTAPQALPTVTSALKDLVAKAPADAQLRGEYATVLDFFRTFDEREHTSTVEAERAARAAPQDVRLQLLAAELHRDDLNLRRHFLEAALRADPTSTPARVALAEHELERGHPERAIALLGPAVESTPDSAPARLTLARAHEALGEAALAHRMVEETLQRLPRLPRVVRAAASASRQMDRPQEAVARLRVALALRHDDRTSRALLALQLADVGQVEDAAREYAQLLALDPFDNATRLRLAELRAANGQLDAATAHFAEARALSPDEPEVYEREGRALLSAGRREEALAAFERSLALRPQNPALKEAMRTLKGESASTGAQYLVDFKGLLREAEGYTTEDAVYLVDTTYVRVQKSGLSGRLHQFAVKVLNARGVDAFRSYPVTYSPDRQEVRILRARITKPDGSVVDSYGESDRNINEPWTGMYYDARAKVLSFPALAAGDVLELQYRVDDTAQENLLSDYWGDVENVQGVYPKVHYQFLVEMPRERPLYWNEKKLPGVTHAREDVEAGRVLYRWSARHVAKVVPEPGMPGWAEVAANLHVSTYRTWDEVGRYWWGLIRDQLTPNEELRRTVDTVLQGVDRKDQQAVVRAIYNFVVTNTRYVALEFGIHGYKPYRVDRVLARRFGDCKDKASLIHSMLKVAGVDSRLVLLRMRNLGSIGEEPASLAAFNHAIVYVPRFDLYLDGTAEFHGARELPSSDRVANVLVVEPGGKATFLTTPEARAEDNATRLTMNLTLRPDGGAEVTGASTVGGQLAPEYRRAYRAVASRRSTFERSWAQSFPGLAVHEVKLNDTTRLDDDVQVDFRMTIPRFAEAMPGQLRFLPFGTGRSYTQSYASLAARRFDLVMNGPWANSFTFRYTLPPGYSVAELPSNQQEETPFGRLRLTFRQEGHQLICDGEVAITAARVEADDYAAFRAFLGRVDQAFARKVTLRGPASPTAGR
jgi:tetratricopeptide (TPR) repeat protein/transglutaminase-like putative cysteine protease